MQLLRTFYIITIMYIRNYSTRICRFSSIVILFFTLLSLPQNSRCEHIKGKWILHQRQTPQHDIRSIYALPDGKIWVETDYSFHVFDGRLWQKIPYDSAILGYNSPFTCDSKGQLYFVNTRGDLIIWDNGSIEEYSSGQLKFPLVGAFLNGGELYIGSYNTVKGGIYKF